MQRFDVPQTAGSVSYWDGSDRRGVFEEGGGQIVQCRAVCPRETLGHECWVNCPWGDVPGMPGESGRECLGNFPQEVPGRYVRPEGIIPSRFSSRLPSLRICNG